MSLERRDVVYIGENVVRMVLALLLLSLNLYYALSYFLIFHIERKLNCTCTYSL
jgi:hypothetical protein